MAAPSEEPSGRGGRSASLRRLKARLPQVRLLAILLAALGIYGVAYLGNGTGVAPLVALPLLAAAVDLVFARIRFVTPRFPDAALATGLFLALIFPPTVPLVAAGGATVLAVTVRHALRTRGRPWFNPAGAGVVLGAVLFGLAPAWWGSLSEPLMIALGALLLVYEWRNWRLAIVFLGAYGALAVVQRLVLSATTGAWLAPNVLLLTAVDPAVLFFALFMVVEPRTAPSDVHLQPVYAVVVAAGGALLPLIFPTLAVLVALLAGNLLAAVLRRAPAAAPAPDAPRRRPAAERAPKPYRAPTPRWSLGRRAGIGMFVFVAVGFLALAIHAPGATSPPILGGGQVAGGGGATAAGSVCQNDNGSIPAGTLASLHKTLGPSVVLSYNAGTGLVVFFDPVNQVTVTETDLYEDFGFAEFNSDDYATAGCVPP